MKNVETLIKEAMASTDSTQALKTWAVRRGATVAGTTDAVHQVLTEAGFTGSIQDQWDAFLDGARYTGDLAQKLRLFWQAGGIQDYARWLFTHAEAGAWYDPSDLSTLFQDAAGTVPVVAHGDPVRLMRDKSGNEKHATAPSDAARPLYGTDGTLHWLDFDGTTHRMVSPAIDFTGGDQMSLFCGLNIDAAAAYNIPVELNDYVGDGVFTVGVQNLAVYSGSKGTLSVIPSTPIVYGTSYVVSGLHEINPPLASVRANGVAVINNSTQGTGNYASAALSIGGRTNNLSHMNGKMYGLIVRGAPSSTNQLADAEAYIASKTGVTL